MIFVYIINYIDIFKTYFSFGEKKKNELLKVAIHEDMLDTIF